MLGLLFRDDGPAGAGFKLPNECVMEHELHPCAADSHFEVRGEQVTPKFVGIFLAVWHYGAHHDGDGIAIPKRVSHAGDAGGDHFGHRFAMGHFTFFDEVGDV